MYNSYLQTVRTIENPPIPIEHDLESGGAGLTPNAELLIHGTPYGGSKKGFAVEFLGRDDAVVLHMNPRFKFFEHTVVLNSADAGGKWQKEERHNSVFRLDQPFKLQILNLGDHFKMVVNDKDFCSFRHRIPTSQVTKVKVHGDVRVQKLQLIMMVPSPSNPAPVNYPPPPAVPYDYGGSGGYGWPQQPAAPSYAPNMPQPPSNPSLGGSVASTPSITGYPPAPNSFYPSLSQNPSPNVPQVPTPNYSAGNNF